MTLGYFNFIYWLLAAIILALGMIGYYVKVLGALGKYGYDDTIKLLPSSQIKQYEQICREEGVQTGRAKFMVWFPTIGFLLVIGWFALLAIDFIYT